MRHGQKQSDNVQSSRIPCEVVNTPGPYVAYILKVGGEWTYVIKTASNPGKHIATINKYAKCGDWSCAEENMNLLAAAPELLAACVEFVRKCECGQARSKASYAEMKAAIAKSQGE